MEIAGAHGALDVCDLVRTGTSITDSTPMVSGVFQNNYEYQEIQLT